MTYRLGSRTAILSVLLASCSAGLAGQERAGPVTSGPEAAAPAATQPLPKAKEAATTPDDYFLDPRTRL